MLPRTAISPAAVDWRSSAPLLAALLVAMAMSCGEPEGNTATPIDPKLNGQPGGLGPSGGAGSDQGGAGRAGGGGGGGTGEGSTLPGASEPFAGPDENGALPGDLPVVVTTDPNGPGLPGAGVGASTGGGEGAEPGGNAKVVLVGGAPAGNQGTVHAHAGPVSGSHTFAAKAAAAAHIELVVRTPFVAADAPLAKGVIAVRAADGSSAIAAGTEVALVAESPGQAPIEVVATVDGDGLADVGVALPEGWFQVGVVGGATLHARLIGKPISTAKIAIELGKRPDLSKLIAPSLHAALPLAPVPAGASFSAALHAHTVVDSVEHLEAEVQYDVENLEFIGATFDAKFTGSFEAAGGKAVIVLGRKPSTPSAAAAGKLALGHLQFKVKVGAKPSAKAWIKITIKGFWTVAGVPLAAPGGAVSLVDATGVHPVGHVTVGADKLVGLLALAHHGTIVNTSILDGKPRSVAIKVLAIWSHAGAKAAPDAALQSEDDDVARCSDGHCRVDSDSKRGAVKLQVGAAWQGLSAWLWLRVWFPAEIRVEADDTILQRITGKPAGGSEAACGDFYGYQATRVRAIARFDLGTSTGTTPKPLEADVSTWLHLDSSEPALAECEDGLVRGKKAGNFQVRARRGKDGPALAQAKLRCEDDSPVFVETLEAVAANGVDLWQSNPGDLSCDDDHPIRFALVQKLHKLGAKASILAWARCSDGKKMPVLETFGLHATALVSGVIEVHGKPLHVIAKGEAKGKLVKATWACGSAWYGEGYVWIWIKFGGYGSNPGGGGGGGGSGGGGSGGGGSGGGGSGGGGGSDGGGSDGGGSGGGGGGGSGGGGSGGGGSDGGGSDGGGSGGGGGGGGGGNGGGGNGGCKDADKDGFGDGCAPGPDCDDNNANFGALCPDCAKHPFPGCKCSIKAQNCYSGDPTWIGKGECGAGVQLCQGGYWSICQGELLPIPEVCDGKDNNCNGLIDDGVLSTCGTCDLSCTAQTVGPDHGTPFVPGGGSSKGVDLDANGYLVLADKTKEIDLNHIWISNSGEQTVSKLNTKSGKEVGRYKVCGDPSRTAVDLNGDVWVGCRAGAAVAKIHTDVKNCADKNGNGKIDTSSDVNNDGVIQANEMQPMAQDECIRFVVKPPGVQYVRAVGVDKDNYGWIGDWNIKVLWRLHPDTGAVVDTIPIGCSPYGITIDQKGIIWVAGRGCGAILAVDPKTKQVTQHSGGAAFSPYGINVDIYGKIWTGNCCDNHSGIAYNPETGKFDGVAVGARPRGVATHIEGYVFVANDQTQAVAKINAKTLKNEGSVSLGAGRFPIGMAVDYDGFVWAVNQQKCTATKIDGKTMQIIGEYPVGSSPYTYSDMTGYTLHNFTAPRGHYTTVFAVAHSGGVINEFSAGQVDWSSISVDAIVPAQGYIAIRWRTAENLKALENAAWSEEVGPFPPLTFPYALGKDGKKVIGKFLQVDVILQAGTEKKSPVVKSISVKGTEFWP